MKSTAYIQFHATPNNRLAVKGRRIVSVPRPKVKDPMSTLSSTTAISSFGSVIAPAPARVAGNRLEKLDRFAIENQARVHRAAVVGEFIGGGLANLWTYVRSALRRQAAVAELSALDDRMLADIGLTRSEIRAAVNSAAGFGPDLPVGPGMTASFNDNVGVRAA